MVYIRPWDKESKRILQGLSKFPRMETQNNKIATTFGRKHSELIGEYFDIASTSYRKKENKTIFSKTNNTVVVPKKGKFFFYKI